MDDSASALDFATGTRLKRLSGGEHRGYDRIHCITAGHYH